MGHRSLTRALSAAVISVVIGSGLVVGSTATARAEPGTPPGENAGVLDCVVPLNLADCLTEEPDLLGSGVVGEPLTVVEPVFGLLSVEQIGLVDTDISWLCNGNPIPGTEGLTELVPTEAMEGCDITVRTVSTLLGLLPLTLVTDVIGITGDGEADPELPASLLSVLSAPPVLSGSGEIGEPLTLTEPVLDLAPDLQGLLNTDVTWLCDDVPIPGATGLSFVPTQAQAGCEIAVRTVTTLLTLLPLELVTDVVNVDEEPKQGQLTASRAPRIQKVGRLLRIDPGTWVADLVTRLPGFHYQWYNTDGPIPGADGREFVPGIADAGRPVAALVTATLAGFLDGEAATNVVKVAKAKSKTRLKKVGKKLVRVKVGPGKANPTGKVRLVKAGRTLKTVRLKAADNGRRTVRLPKLRKGAHRIRAIYAGNKALKRSRSKAVRVVVR